MIINELLNYVHHYLDRSAIDHIKTIVLKFYTVNEVTEAKKCMWHNFKDYLEPYVERKSTGNRSAEEANLDDIFKAFKVLDEKGVNCEFVSQDLSRLPSVNPEELNTTFLLERVTLIEKRLADYDNVLNNQRIDLMKLQDNVVNFDGNKRDGNTDINVIQNNVLKTPDCVRLNSNKNFDKVFENNFTDSNVKSLIEKFNNKNLELIKKKRHYSDGAIVLNKTHSYPCLETNIDKKINEVYPVANFKENHDVKDFSIENSTDISKYDKSRANNFSDLKSNTVRSGVFYSRKNSDTNRSLSGGTFSRVNNFESRLKGPEKNYLATKDVFIYRVTEGSITDVQNHCSSKGIRNFKVTLTSHSNSKFKSFKLTVRSLDFEKVIKRNFWPKGVCCRPFKNLR